MAIKTQIELLFVVSAALGNSYFIKHKLRADIPIGSRKSPSSTATSGKSVMLMATSFGFMQVPQIDLFKPTKTLRGSCVSQDLMIQSTTLLTCSLIG